MDDLTSLFAVHTMLLRVCKKLLVTIWNYLFIPVASLIKENPKHVHDKTFFLNS